jgi:hypothetical protein
MMLFALLALLALPQSDTTVVVQGLLVKAPPAVGGAWMVALPTPLAFRERSIGELELQGDTMRWNGFNGHYVEVRGTLASTLTSGQKPRGLLAINHIKEVDPPGTARKTVSSSWSHRVALVLWVLPQKFSWRTPTGQPSGVGPVIVYTLNNHSESDVNLLFETRDFVCFSVEPRDGGAPAWTHTRTLDQPRDRQRVTLPKFVREVARLPEAAAPTPGSYVVRAGLCGFKEYEMETEIEVLPASRQ